MAQFESTGTLYRSQEEIANNSAPRKQKTDFFTPYLLVYISHFLSSWGDRMWIFAAGLFLVEITPKSLRLIAIYQASLSLTVIFLGASIGRWVDRSSRLTAAQLSLFVQNVMVCICTLLLCIIIANKDGISIGAQICAQTGFVLLACIAEIGTVGSKIAIEKDWIVVICSKDDHQLSKMNSVLRTVDLSTEMMAPVLVGFIMTYSGMIAGGIAIACWNVVSFMVEYGVLHYLFKTIPALQKPKQKPIEAEVMKDQKKHRSIIDYLEESKETWTRYFSHDIREAGISLSLLFMTVLALDNYSRAYVYEAGVNKLVLGLLTACASFAGILGSISFPVLRKKIGVVNTGLVGYSSEVICLLFCVAAVFAPGTLFGPFDANVPDVNYPAVLFNQSDVSNTSYVVTVPNGTFTQISNSNPDYTSVGLLLTGIILSRFGLWVADLTITQILQEDVQENERGGINGVQYSLNQIFSLLRSVLLIILPSIATFGYMIILSFVFVCVGEIFFIIYALKKRKQLTVAPKSEIRLSSIEPKIRETPSVSVTVADDGSEFDDVPL